MATNLRGEEGLLLELRDGPEHLRRVGEHVDDRVVDARRLCIKRQGAQGPREALQIALAPVRTDAHRAARDDVRDLMERVRRRAHAEARRDSLQRADVLRDRSIAGINRMRAAAEAR